MMYNFPFFSHFSPRSYYGYPQKNLKNKNQIHNNEHMSSNAKYSNKGAKVSYNEKLSNYKFDNKEVSKEEDRLIEENTVFEFFGIKLHFDDLLLILLIFFLYNEGVKDEFLFIALVLLLLS